MSKINPNLLNVRTQTGNYCLMGRFSICEDIKMFMNRLWAVNRNNTQKGNLHNKDRIMGDFFSILQSTI